MSFRSHFKRHPDGVYRAKAGWTDGRNYEHSHELDIDISPIRSGFHAIISGEDMNDDHKFQKLRDAMRWAVTAVHGRFGCCCATVSPI